MRVPVKCLWSRCNPTYPANSEVQTVSLDGTGDVGYIKVGELAESSQSVAEVQW